jgi:hypothetical protein
MKTIKLNVLTGLFTIILFAGNVYAQTGEICDYPNLLSGKTFNPGAPYYAPGWNPSENYTCIWKDGALSLYLGDATLDVWQAQFFLSISPVVTLIPDESYCISFDIETNVDLPRVFIKCYKDGDDNRFIELPGRVVGTGKQTVSGIYFNSGNTTVTEINKLLFDFGYNPAGASIVISNIAIRGNDPTTNNDNIPGNEIRVFPNPVKDKLHIHGLEHTSSEIKILDLSGQVCLEVVPAKEIDLSSLRQGLYFVVAGSKTFKIIKQ